MPPTELTHSLQHLEARLAEYPAAKMQAAATAINRTMMSVRKEGVARLRRDLAGLSAGAVRRQTKISRATPRELMGVLAFSPKRFRLFGNFTNPGARTVRIGRLPWRIEGLDGEPVSPADLRRAFIQRARTSGVPNVWIRTSLVGKRYPITALLAPSLATAVAERGHRAALLAYGRARFSVVLEREFKFRLGRI